MPGCRPPGPIPIVATGDRQLEAASTRASGIEWTKAWAAEFADTELPTLPRIAV